MNDRLPGFTILIPTYNSAARLRRCLDSIARQDYPADRVQIIVADGGSTDDTRGIALEYAAEVVDNPLRLAEEGLRAGMPQVSRELLVVFADDNELVGENWLRTVDRIFEDNPALSAFWCRIAASDDDPAINKYYALIQTEPLSFFLNRNTDWYMGNSDALVSDGIEYHVFEVDPGRPLV